MRGLLLPTSVVLVTSACASGAGDPGVAPPTLRVESPTRGTQWQGDVVEVTGQASDDGTTLRVTVNGVDAEVTRDGRFVARVPVGSGVTILETIADDGVHQVHDARAVLAGDLQSVATPVAEAVGARVSPGAFAAMSTALTETLRATDLTEVAQGQNPLFNDGGCLGARVDISQVAIADAQVALVPGAAGLATQVTIDGLDVRVRVRYEVACFDDTTTIRVRAQRVQVGGELTVGVEAGALTTALANPTVELSGFSIDAGGLPGTILSLLDGKIEDEVRSALVDLVRDEVPGMARDALAELAGTVHEVEVFDRAVTLGLTPRAATLDAAGLALVVDAAVTVAGGEGAMFAATPGSATVALGNNDGVAIALADDTLDHLLAGLWTAGALELELPEEVAGALALVVDPGVTTVSLSASLPPTVGAADDQLGLTFGDLVLTARADGGEVLAEIAVSLIAGLAVGADAAGALRLDLATPQVWAQTLSQAARVAEPVLGDEIAELLRGSWGLLGPALDDALDGVVMPSVGGVAMAAPRLVGRDGYLVVEVAMP